MKSIFQAGDRKEFKKVIQQEDVAAFNNSIVHPVYSTFALARDVEWTSRQFVLEMCELNEEGIGTFLSIEHKSPALIGEELLIIAVIDQLINNELICSFEAKVKDRLIATGRTGQKILTREKLEKILKVYE